MKTKPFWGYETKQDPLDRLGKAFLDGHNGKDEEATIKDEESPVL